MKAIKRHIRWPYLCAVLCCGYAAAQPFPKGTPAVDGPHTVAITGLSASGNSVAVSLIRDDKVEAVLVAGSGSASGTWHKDVKRCFFAGDNMVVLNRSGSVSLYNDKGNIIAKFDRVTLVEEVGDDRHFVMRQEGNAVSRLSLVKHDGTVVGSVVNMGAYHINKEKAEVLVATPMEAGTSHVHLLDRGGARGIYSTSNTIKAIRRDKVSDAVILEEGHPLTCDKVVRILDTERRKTYELNALLDVQAVSVSIAGIGEKAGYFVCTEAAGEKENAVVDVWRGDAALEGKVAALPVERMYLWQPEASRLNELSSSRLPKVINTGLERYFPAFDPEKLQDYTSVAPNLEIHRLDAETGHAALIGIFSPDVVVSPRGRHMLCRERGRWVLVDLKGSSKVAIPGGEYSTGYFSTDGHQLLFQGNGGLWGYDIGKARISRLLEMPGKTCSVANIISHGLSSRFFSKKAVDMQGPLLVRVHDPVTSETGYIRWEQGRVSVVVPAGEFHLGGMRYDCQLNKAAYVRENYNVAPEVVLQQAGKEAKVVYKSNVGDTNSKMLRREVVHYKGHGGEQLQGILFYPADYSNERAYPMVVHLYEQQRFRKNRYLSLSYSEPEGFNARALLENGYFVYFPDIAYSSVGPGLSALHCVENAIKALEGNTSIDFKKVGLMGHSFGGYEACFIATHSDRFAAFVCGAANCDLVGRYHSFNTSFSAPEFWRYESGQFRMGASFSGNKALYLENSPLYFAERVTAPVLLWTGMEDYNVRWEETRTFYNALRRSNKEVVALFYPGEGHNISGKEARSDLTLRILEWFDAQLKRGRKPGWLADENKEGAD